MPPSLKKRAPDSKSSSLEPASKRSGQTAAVPNSKETLKLQETNQTPTLPTVVDAARVPASSEGVNPFLRSWAWKREHRPDRDRFVRPYIYKFADGVTTLKIAQAKFKETGFASTVWDSSIVVSKYFEKHSEFRGRRCLDLSAGCGLVGLVLSRLGNTVLATDLEPNLPHLRKNCESNGADTGCQVVEVTWGEDVKHLGPPFDVVVACDVMYIREAIPALVATLVAVSDKQTTVLLAHGRNRGGEEMFLKQAAQHFLIHELQGLELDEVYQCIDVSVYSLKLL